MPFVSCNVTNPLSAAQKEAVKSELGTLITILPGKTESTLMVDISGDHSMYFKGEEKKSCAFVEIRLFGESPLSAKKELTEKLSAMLEKVLGIPVADIYINFLEFSNWGVNGSLK